jgi:hypothetical protein
MNKSLQRELDELKTLSKNQLKRRLLIYRILYFLNLDNFSFCVSLIFCLIPLVFFNFNSVLWILMMCFHYFILWEYIKPKLDLFFQTENDLEELEILIDQISRMINNSTI